MDSRGNIAPYLARNEAKNEVLRPIHTKYISSGTGQNKA